MPKVRNLLDCTVTVLDTETTGLDPDRGDRMLEIALVRLEGGQVTGELHTLVNPGIPVTATEIHRITQAEVDGAPAFRDVAPTIEAWLRGTVVVGHNVSFDHKFVAAEFTHAGLTVPSMRLVCTREGARELLDLPGYRLGDCCEHLEIVLDGWHAALADTRATAELCVKLDERARSRGRGFVVDGPWFDAVVPTAELPTGPVHHRTGTPVSV